MYEFLFIGPLLVLFLILLYHSLKIGGKKETLRFFGIAFIFSFFRELIIGSTYPLYFGSYRVEIGPITLSPAIIFGWIFAFYLAHYFVQTLTTNTGVESHLLVKITLGAFVVLGISLVMETTAPLLGWWSWKTGLLESLPAGSLLFGAPIFVFVGWVITGVTFLTIYYLLQEYQFKPKIIFVSIGIFTIIMINFVIGNYNILYYRLSDDDNMIVESKVGSKGELFLTKDIQEALGWKLGDAIFSEVRDNELIVRHIPNLLELLEKPPLGEPESPDEIEKELEQFFTIQLHIIP